MFKKIVTISYEATSLRSKREKAGISLSELADSCNISVSFLSRLERRIHRVDLRLRDLIIDRLDVLIINGKDL